MGLLDDAIREHLELKRLRGADPGLVSREESEVFGPARDQQPSDEDSETAIPEDLSDEDVSPAHDPGQPEGFSNVGQETAELDMRTMLEDEGGAPSSPGPAGPSSSGASQEPGVTQDSLEWEMPGEGSDDQADGTTDEPVEDVLEETPDFLRDTPEQERLWFEQRPPRDFDFDK
ncbi:MAG: hypothetical protein WB709_12930 [Solirubrobacteraceae bacterium]